MRIESVSKSPIYNHFGGYIHGASTIRAYCFQSRNFELIDQNNQGKKIFKLFLRFLSKLLWLDYCLPVARCSS